MAQVWKFYQLFCNYIPTVHNLVTSTMSVYVPREASWWTMLSSTNRMPLSKHIHAKSRTATGWIMT